MQELTARQILSIPRMEVFNIPQGIYKVSYDDGQTCDISSRLIVFNRYVWELFLLFPNTPIVKDICVTKFVEKDGFNGDTHRQVFEAIFKYICEFNKLDSYSQKEPLLKTIYKIIDLLQNEVLNMISEYVGTIHATDFIQVVKDPEIVSMYENFDPTPDGVDKSYKIIRNYVSCPKRKLNRFVAAYRAKSINDNQANQCIGPRGFSTDLDRTVFRVPIKSGFIRGLHTLYEIMAESCTAAKALNASGTHIQTSEYTSRRIQLLTMPVRGVVPGDCGSDGYWSVVITPQNIVNFKGIYYVNDEEKLDYIRGDENYLYQKLIKVRNAFDCKLEDPSKICSTCLGRVSLNFKDNSNLGYTMTAYLMEKLTQAILSTKHLTHSVKKSLITLQGLAVKYFYVTEAGDLYIRPDIDLTGLQIILPNAKVGKLVDVLNLQHTNIALSKIGELDTIAIKDNKPKTPVIEKLDISYKDRNCIITRAFLDYIKNTEMESDPRGNFVISLDRFDKSKPIFNNPLKETNILNFVNRVSSIVETNKDKIVDPYDKLDLLMRTVHEKFNCNVSVLQVIVYATTAFNPLNGNYRLGRGSPVKTCEPKTSLFRHRSFSGLAVFEQQMGEIISRPADTFTPGHREPHPMSVFVAPQFNVD